MKPEGPSAVFQTLVLLVRIPLAVAALLIFTLLLPILIIIGLGCLVTVWPFCLFCCLLHNDKKEFAEIVRAPKDAASMLFGAYPAALRWACKPE